jgi:hypothetical protein
MGHGGRRPGAGRPKGSIDKRVRWALDAGREAIRSVLGPDAFDGNALALFQVVYRDPAQPLELRIEAAKAAIPYESAPLQVMEARVGIHTLASRQLSEAEMHDLLTVIDATDDEMPLLPGPTT